MIMEDVDKIEKQKRSKGFFNTMEKECGLKQRVFAIQLVRPFYGFDVENRYRDELTRFNTMYRQAIN